MEKEFIPYEQALVLKELGFDEKCLGLYKFSNLTLEYPYLTNTGLVNSNLEKYCSAPLYQQAFGWFREKYGYDVSIKKCRPTEYKFVITQSFVENDYYFIDYPFPSHENAELECLKKLIEIVKRKIV